MPYRITIEEITTDNYVSKDWKCLWDDGVFKADILPALRKKDKYLNGDSEPSQYGYVETEASREVRREIYKQEVLNLDLPAVIRAANSM